MPRTKTYPLPERSPVVTVCYPPSPGQLHGPCKVVYFHSPKDTDDSLRDLEPIRAKMCDVVTQECSLVYLSYAAPFEPDVHIRDENNFKLIIMASPEGKRRLHCWVAHAIFEEAPFHFLAYFTGDADTPAGWLRARLVTDAKIVDDKTLREGGIGCQLQYDCDRKNGKYEAVGIFTNGYHIAIYCKEGKHDYVPSIPLSMAGATGAHVFQPKFPCPFLDLTVDMPDLESDEEDEPVVPIPTAPGNTEAAEHILASMEQQRRVVINAPQPKPAGLYEHSTALPSLSDLSSPTTAAPAGSAAGHAAAARTSAAHEGRIASPSDRARPSRSAAAAAVDPVATPALPAAHQRGTAATPTAQATPTRSRSALVLDKYLGDGANDGSTSHLGSARSAPGHRLRTSQQITSAGAVAASSRAGSRATPGRSRNGGTPSPVTAAENTDDPNASVGMSSRQIDAASTGPQAPSLLSSDIILPGPATPVTVPGSTHEPPPHGVVTNVVPAAAAGQEHRIVTTLRVNILKAMASQRMNRTDMNGLGLVGPVLSGARPFQVRWNYFAVKGPSLDEIFKVCSGSVIEPVALMSSKALFCNKDGYKELRYRGALSDISFESLLLNVCNCSADDMKHVQRGVPTVGTANDCFSIVANVVIGTTRGRQIIPGTPVTTFALFVLKFDDVENLPASEGLGRKANISGIVWPDIDLPSATSTPRGDPVYFHRVPCQIRRGGIRVAASFIAGHTEGVTAQMVTNCCSADGEAMTMLKNSAAKGTPFGAARHFQSLVDVKNRDLFSMIWTRDEFAWRYNQAQHHLGFRAMTGDLHVTLASVTITRKMRRFKRALKALYNCLGE